MTYFIGKNFELMSLEDAVERYNSVNPEEPIDLAELQCNYLDPTTISAADFALIADTIEVMERALKAFIDLADAASFDDARSLGEDGAGTLVHEKWKTDWMNEYIAFNVRRPSDAAQMQEDANLAVNSLISLGLAADSDGVSGVGEYFISDDWKTIGGPNIRLDEVLISDIPGAAITLNKCIKTLETLGILTIGDIPR